MQNVFNLKSFFKKAFYDDVRGYALRNQRCFGNCLKLKMGKNKKSKQEAYQDCIKEYNEIGNEKWLEQYAGSYAETIETDNSTPAAKKIKNAK